MVWSRVVPILSILFCLLLLGCVVSPSISVSFGEKVRLAFGQTLFLKGTEYAVTLKDVLEDSRCHLRRNPRSCL